MLVETGTVEEVNEDAPEDEALLVGVEMVVVVEDTAVETALEEIPGDTADEVLAEEEEDALVVELVLEVAVVVVTTDKVEELAEVEEETEGTLADLCRAAGRGTLVTLYNDDDLLDFGTGLLLGDDAGMSED